MTEACKEKIDRLSKIITEGVNEVFHSDRYAEWLRFCSRMHHYSLNNQILIYMQSRGKASQVAGFKTWQMLGRKVTKGEHGIMIFAPMKINGPDETEEIIFRPTTVFDVSQTTGKPLPELTMELTEDSESYRQLIDQLIKIAPVPVEFTEDLPNGVYGCFDPTCQQIKVRSSLHDMARLKTLIHEIVHSLLDNNPKLANDPNNPKERKLERSARELRAESSAFIVCMDLGIDVSNYSFGYLAGWSEGKIEEELKEVMQDVHDVSDYILSQLKINAVQEQIKKINDKKN